MTTPDALPDLRTTVEGLEFRIPDRPKTERQAYVKADVALAIEAVRDAVLALIPEGAVLVTEEGLAAALRDTEEAVAASGVVLGLDTSVADYAAAILAILRDTP